MADFASIEAQISNVFDITNRVADTKFGRNYILKVEKLDGNILTIDSSISPFTIEFDINRDTLSSLSSASIRIFNLGKENRDQLEFNIYNQGSNRSFQLQAGYGNNLPIIFIGNITQAWSVREGVNFITQIESNDGGYAANNAVTTDTTTFPANYPNRQVIVDLIDLLKPFGIKRGRIGSYPGNTGRGKSYSGPICSILTQLSNKGFFIDNGFANALGNDEFISTGGVYPLINAQSGLLGTPVREQTILTFDMIFEPRLVVGQVINLQSQTISNSQQTQAVNGLYKVTSIKHRGVISKVICGDAITSLGMFLGQNESGENQLVPV